MAVCCSCRYAHLVENGLVDPESLHERTSRSRGSRQQMGIGSTHKWRIRDKMAGARELVVDHVAGENFHLTLLDNSFHHKGGTCYVLGHWRQWQAWTINGSAFIR